MLNTTTLLTFLATACPLAAALAQTTTAGVGVGTTTPQAQLHVESSNGGQPHLLLRNPAGGANGLVNFDMQTYNTPISNLRLQAVDNNYGADLLFLNKRPGAPTNPLVERLRLTNSGNLGVGTGTPNAPLTVQARSGDGAALGFYTSGGVDKYNFSLGTTGLNLSESSVAGGRLFIENGGNVGIGTTDPSQKLEVAGPIYSNSGGFRFPDNSVQVTAASSSSFVLNGTTQQPDASFNISGNGLVGGQLGVGTTAPASSAAVEIASTTQALLLPRLTDGQMNAIANPVAGLLIYNTTKLKFYGYGLSSSPVYINQPQHNQTNYTLPVGGTDGQVFTATVTGALLSVTVGLAGTNTQSTGTPFTLTLFAGAGLTNGQQLATFTQNVQLANPNDSTASYNVTFVLPAPVPISTGQQYTFSFSRNDNQPLSVMYASGNPYAGGYELTGGNSDLEQFYNQYTW